MTVNFQGQVNAHKSYADSMERAARIFEVEGPSTAYHGALNEAEEHYDHFRYFSGDYD